MDPLFRVDFLAATPNPSKVTYAALHQDYSEDFVADERLPSEDKCAEIVVKRLLTGEFHGGPLEHPQITLAIGFFPHSVMQQARTHRVAVSVDCQSMRYTGARIIQVADHERSVEEVFYLRPVGHYADRFGKKYFYDELTRHADKLQCIEAAKEYKKKVEELGWSEEHARGLIPFDFRQHFVMSFNSRSLMHFLDMRSKADAQQEIRWLCELMMIRFEQWMPAVAAWYKKTRYAKARLAP